MLNNDSSLSQLVLCVAADLDKLGIMIRTQIGKLLDPSNEGHDWKELAKKLGLETLITPISFSKAPTKALLDNYEVVYPYHTCLIQHEYLAVDSEGYVYHQPSRINCSMAGCFP